MSVKQVWKRKTSTPKSSPPSQNDSPPLPTRVYLQSPSPPSYNPSRDQMINQLHNISTILDLHNNPSNAYIHVPPSPPPPQIHLLLMLKLNFTQVFIIVANYILKIGEGGIAGAISGGVVGEARTVGEGSLIGSCDSISCVLVTGISLAPNISYGLPSYGQVGTEIRKRTTKPRRQDFIVVSLRSTSSPYSTPRNMQGIPVPTRPYDGRPYDMLGANEIPVTNTQLMESQDPINEPSPTVLASPTTPSLIAPAIPPSPILRI
nr:hypothetical protein [Tanacetum cinerariifolium]